jgi:DNA-binding NtrC family response regulator
MPSKPPEEAIPTQEIRGDESVPTDLVRALDFDSTAVERFSLRVAEGPDAGKAYESKGERAVVGTHRSADFVLTDGAVSRFHCEITVKDGKALVQDLGSKNGTIVDGVAIERAFLAATSIITVGRSELRFEMKGDRVEVLLAPQEKFGLMIGGSAEMRAVFLRLKHAAQQASTSVLIQGDAGTGKDLAAESIHFESERRDGPLIVVDCAAAPMRQIEQELEEAFSRGAGGTLILDEVGELSLPLQRTLLGALDRRSTDVRVIATSRRNLRKEVNAGRFRADLYYTLAVIDITLPPLESRKDDIPLLVHHLLESMGALELPGVKELATQKWLGELAEHPWPGNVRELRSYLERCVAMRNPLPLDEESLVPENLDTLPPIDVGKSLRDGRDRWIRYFERKYLQELLAEHDQNVSAAARAAGIDRVHLYRLLTRAGLR